MLVETASFQLADDVGEAAFLAADEARQAELSPRRGFVRRTTARGAAGEWLVLTLWGSAADADAAPPSVPADLVDPGSLHTGRYETLD